MNSNATKAQKVWQQWQRDQGCCFCGCPAETHHIKGSKFKLKGFGQVGEWLTLPLCYWHHRDPSNPENVTQWRNRFEKYNGKQTDLLKDLHTQWLLEKGNMIFDVEIIKRLL